MSTFKEFYLALDIDSRERFARTAGTTVGYCSKLIYGGARVELGLADVMVAAAHGQLTHDGIPMTRRAKEQMRKRAVLRGKETADA